MNRILSDEIEHIINFDIYMIIKKLLEKNIDINHKCVNNYTMLMKVCSIKNICKYCDVFSRIIAFPDIDYNFINTFGNTALMIAIKNENECIALSLLELPDIDYNNINDDDCTALIISCKNGLLSVALRLLDMPDINHDFYPYTGNTALYYAKINTMHTVIEKIESLMFIKIDLFVIWLFDIKIDLLIR